MANVTVRAVRPAVVAHLVAGLLATVLAYDLWIGGHAAAREAVRRHGSNVDAGAIEVVVAMYVVAPATVLFWLAALAGWRQFRGALVLHWAALLVELALVPLFAVTAIGVVSRLS